MSRILLIIIVVLVVTNILSIDGCIKQSDKNDSQNLVINALNDTVSKWKDKYGREHSSKLLAEGNLDVLNTMYGHKLDSVSMALKVAKKHIKSLSTIGVFANRLIVTDLDTFYIDSNKYYTFQYKDSWLDMSAVIKDSVTLKYKSFDSLVITTYSKKQKGFLNFKRDTYIDGYSLNPYSTIRGIEGIRVYNEKRKRWGVGPYFGYGFDGKTFRAQAGISINYDLIQF